MTRLKTAALARTPARTRAIIRDLRTKPFLLLGATTVLLFAGLLVYSETWAAAWDEGFHILAAQLIRHGKKPYIDFLFPQTPLNAYWVAAWMRVFGESWRMVHALAATLTAGAILITGEYVLRRFPIPDWRFPAAMFTVLTLGLNMQIFQFGVIGQAYAFCLFSIVAAYRFAILAPDGRSAVWPALAGFASATAAAGSLLTAPVAPVLLLWILIRNQIGNRWWKGIAFLVGAVVPFLPVIWLFAESPRATRFNIFDYHFFYRQLDWEGAIPHDLDVVTAWVYSSPDFIVGLLAVAGLWFVVRRSGWERSLRWEFYLCAWLTVALALHISNAHPTFARYYLFAMPFIAIMASAGLYITTARLYDATRPWAPIAVLTLLFLMGLGKTLYERRESMNWVDFEQVAKKVDEVTPAHGSLLADEFVYFLTKREPPAGMELEDSHKLNNLDLKFAAAMHVLPRKEMDNEVRSGRFATVETCDDDDERIESLHLTALYSNRVDVSGCAVYWNWVKPAAVSKTNPAPKK